ncbi:MAG: ATP-binding protein [Nitrospinae bacterium]|nr:ATP-binding protein [Nitrospinota bacterium]
MTHAKTKTETCPHCRGTHYRLANAQGMLNASVCECFRCERCNGDGRVYFLDEKGFSYVRDCQCADFKKRLQLLNRAGIPGKFLNVSFETYFTNPPHHETQKTAKSRAIDFVKDFGAAGKTNFGLVFMGDAGTGKTHLAVSVIKALTLEKGVECKFVDFFQLLSDIRHGYSQDKSEQALINPYVRARVLVIDELAKGRNTEWELTVLDQIISSRYNGGDKVTLFTTNFKCESTSRDPKKGGEMKMLDLESQSYADLLARQTLPEKIGPRIYSRLAEMCNFIEIKGEDQRQVRLKPSQQFPRPKK